MHTVPPLLSSSESSPWAKPQSIQMVGLNYAADPEDTQKQSDAWQMHCSLIRDELLGTRHR